MPIPIVAGNWKMNTSLAEGVRLASQVAANVGVPAGIEVVVCPPFVSLAAVAQALQGTGIEVGAQNMHSEERGAFTGEVAPGMLAGLCRYVILGHSERRALFGETDDMVNRKVAAAVAAGLIPILCVGETLAQREEGRASDVISQQLRGGLAGLHNVPGLVVAYEPVWAIGTGQAATPEIAHEIMGGVIQPVLAALLGGSVAQDTPLLYGGSVNPGTSRALPSSPRCREHWSEVPAWMPHNSPTSSGSQPVPRVWASGNAVPSTSPRLIAVVGPTASGKSKLALELAKNFHGQIVSADSRQVYRYMDIGTAKPSQADRQEIPHHLHDLLDPNQRFDLATFLDLAQGAISGIHAHGQLPILAGGSGQYVWALLEGWQLPTAAPDERLTGQLGG